MHVCCVHVDTQITKGAGSSGTGVTVVMSHLAVSLGTELGTSGRAAGALDR